MVCIYKYKVLSFLELAALLPLKLLYEICIQLAESNSFDLKMVLIL